MIHIIYMYSIVHTHGYRNNCPFMYWLNHSPYHTHAHNMALEEVFLCRTFWKFLRCKYFRYIFIRARPPPYIFLFIFVWECGYTFPLQILLVVLWCTVCFYTACVYTSILHAYIHLYMFILHAYIHIYIYIYGMYVVRIYMDTCRCKFSLHGVKCVGASSILKGCSSFHIIEIHMYLYMHTNIDIHVFLYIHIYIYMFMRACVHSTA